MTDPHQESGLAPQEERIVPPPTAEGTRNIHGKVVVIVPYLGWVKIGMMQYVLPNMIFVLAAFAVIAAIYYGRRLI